MMGRRFSTSNGVSDGVSASRDMPPGRATGALSGHGPCRVTKAISRLLVEMLMTAVVC